MKCPICNEELPHDITIKRCLNFESWRKERLVDFLNFALYNHPKTLTIIYDDYEEFMMIMKNI